MSNISIDFNNIRPIDGSLEKGFEEFVCQLAKRESIPNAKKFIRNGSPDAGCECYWILDNGKEYAWQAKYFKTSLGIVQFKQIEKSIETALEKHPNIVKYFIAIPQNLPDVRIKGKSSAKDKLDKKLKEWHKKHSKTEFIIWQESNLITKIQKQKNIEIIKFWFDKEFLSKEWFERQNKNAIVDLGPKYTPEINVELDISKVFNGLAKNERFTDTYKEFLDAFLQQINHFMDYTEKKILSFEKELKKYYNNIKDSVLFLTKSIENKDLKFKKIKEHIASIKNNIGEIRNIYSEKIEKKLQNCDDRTKNLYEYFTHLLDRTNSYFYKTDIFINGESVALYDNPFLLICGNAGCGKSHLFADIVNQRMKNNNYSILLLGHRFFAGNSTRNQLLEQLELKNECNFQEFLYALQCISQISNSRVIIFIDAINESTPKDFWKDEMNSFVQDIKRFDGLGLAISVRSTYLSLFEDNLKDFVKIEHYGFNDETTAYNAIKTFFAYYKLPLPNIPLFLPEFTNPLFLKLFCKGLQNENIRSIDNEKIDPSYIFDIFISSINEELYGLHSSLSIIDKFIDTILSEEIRNNFMPLSYDKCAEIFAEINKKYDIHNVSLENLISEGLLIKNYSYPKKTEVVYIAYEKLKDYLIAKKVSKNPKNFKKNITELYKQPYSSYFYRGIIEALAIILPKYNNIEIFEFFKNSTNNALKYFINKAFLLSLLYRNNSNCDAIKLKNYINENKLYLKETFLDTLIACSTKQNNPFSIEATHKWLNIFSMSDRDSFWIPFLNNYFQYKSSNINRIIDWCLFFKDKSNIDDDYIKFVAIMLSWFLSSSNRILRDKTTKALIILLIDRPNIVISLLKKFEDVNDPYIYERLYAVAYGVVVRITDKSILKELSEYIYETIFNKEEVYPHILLRDYAKNIIEYTIYLDIKINIDVNKIRPPYKSNFSQIITDAEIEKYKNKGVGILTGIDLIFQSMQVEHNREGESLCYGDFGRYTFQTNIEKFVQKQEEKNNFIMNMKNIAIKYIFNMGYDEKKHGKFDIFEHRNHSDRYYTDTERIGKKYQWIAMHKLLAQLSDKYKIKYFWDEKEFVYEGPWNLNVRNFDPTNLGNQFKPSKNIQINYDNWDTENSKWIKAIKDLPEPINLLIFDNHIWIPLNIFFNMDEPTKVGQEPYSTGKKDFWYLINSYFVENKSFVKITKWLSTKNFHGRWLPEPESLYKIFNREYIFSPAFNSQKYLRDYEMLIDKQETKEIGKVYFTELPNYSFEKENKNQDEYHIEKIKKPCKELFEYFNLIYKEYDNCLYLQNEELACFDNDGTLYFRADLLNKFLSDKNLKLIWTVLGEKRIIKKGTQQEWLEISSVYVLGNNNKIYKNSIKTILNKNYK